MSERPLPAISGRLRVDGSDEERDELSVFDVAGALVRRWRVVAVATLVGCLVALGFALSAETRYTAKALLLPQGAEDTNSAVSRLAGQFGIPGTGLAPVGGWGPAYYIELLATDPVLRPVVARSFSGPDGAESPRQPFLDLFGVTGDNEAHRTARGIELLRSGIMEVEESPETGMVRLLVRTPWPETSAEIAEALVRQLEVLVVETRRTQAAVEREFIEGRIPESRRELLVAEDSLQAFLMANRMFEGAPQLVFEEGRLQREVMLRQQVLMTLLESYEEARIREIRDTPTFTVVEAPDVPARPDPRGRLVMLIVGLLSGLLLGLALVLLVEGFERAKAAEPEKFRDLVDAIQGGRGS